MLKNYQFNTYFNFNLLYLTYKEHGQHKHKSTALRFSLSFLHILCIPLNPVTFIRNIFANCLK